MEVVKKTQSIEGKNATCLACSHPDWFLPYIYINLYDFFGFMSSKVKEIKKKITTDHRYCLQRKESASTHPFLIQRAKNASSKGGLSILVPSVSLVP